MKRYLNLILLLFSISLSAQQQSDTLSHKHQMIDAINRGDYDLAMQHLALVENWDFNPDVEGDWLEINNGLEFVDRTPIETQLLDSFLIYIGLECKLVTRFFYHDGKVKLAIPIAELVVRIYGNILGENHPDYAVSLNDLGVLYYDMGDYAKAESCYLEVLQITKTVHGEVHPDYASYLKKLADVYVAMGDNVKAEPYYLEVLRIRKEVRDENHPDYAASLANLGLLYAEMGEYSKAESYYLESLRIRKEVLEENHPAYAASLNNLGLLYKNMGNYSKAETYYLEVLRIRKSVLGENHPDYAVSLNNLGVLYRAMGDYAKAEIYFLEALRIKKSVLGENHPDYATSLNNLGSLYHDMGDYAKAETYCLETLRIKKSLLGENHPDYVVSLNNLGNLYSNMGEYAKAETYCLEAFRITKSVLGENHPDYATSLNSLGVLYSDMGDYAKAETYYLEALRITKSVLGENHPNYATSLDNLGVLYSDIGDYAKAETYYLEVLRIRKSVLGENHPDYAVSLNSLGVLYSDMGDYAKAETYHLEALRIRKSVLGENHPDYAGSLNNLGILYHDMGDYAKAETYYLEALRIKKSVLGENHPDYAGSLNNLGVLYSKMGDYAKAERYYIEALSIRKTIFVYSTTFMSEQQRKAYWQTMQSYFTNNYTCFTYKYHIHNPSISTFAYNNELFIKGLLLTSTECVKRSILESNDSTLIRQWNELTTKKQQIQVLQEKQPQSDNLKQIQEEAEQLEKEITRSSATYRENQAMWQITWDSVGNYLSPDEVAIEYFSAPLSKDSTMYCALLLRHDSQYPELIPLFEEKEVSSFLSPSEGNITNQTYDFYSNGDTISQLVWSKIQPKIKEGETIYFAPSGLLHQLAIEHLPYDETRTMADVFNMVRLSSTREIVINKQDTKYTTATIYGGIAYDIDEDVLLAESNFYDEDDILASRSIDNDTLNRGSVKYLPGTKKEAESINALLMQNNISAKLYTTTKANEESFKALSGKHNNILHIGTHGFTWTDSIAKKQDFFAQRMQLIGREQHYDASIDPLNRCGLLFAGANIALQGNSKDIPEGVQDGILTAKEISLLDLRDADLVVLSACETAKGDITSEGVFGLQRAFKMAGVQTIIMSLWKVNDQATQLLMTEFYNNWIGKDQSKREAFRNAQNTVRTQYEEPEYWAGFIMLD